MTRKIYEDTLGLKVFLETDQDLTDVSKTQILVQRPDGVEAIWDAETATVDEDGNTLTPEDGIIVATLKDTDIATPGDYKLQSYLEWGSTIKVPGETVVLRIFERFT
jgi:hypothetical protein